jgi:PncC family amidohydrolase
VSYTENAKSRLLGVPAVTLTEQGAVSSAVALAMAEGLAEISGADLVLAVTGLAGPETDGRLPVGTVWLAVAGRWPARTLKCQFRGGRNKIQSLSAGVGRLFARDWWVSKGELDIEGFLADNSSKPFIKLHPPSK